MKHIDFYSKKPISAPPAPKGANRARLHAPLGGRGAQDASSEAESSDWDYQGKRRDQVEGSSKIFVICCAAALLIIIIAAIWSVIS